MSTTTATAHVKQNDNPHATIQTVTSDLAALDINEITAQPEDCDSQDVSSDEEESDVTSIKGTEIKHVVPEITAPDHLTEDEKTRFYEMAKFCPSTLLNKDCIHYHKCALIQPCRKFSLVRWDNFCHHGYRCHNSHKVIYTCRSVICNRQCIKQDCKHSHDIAVRKAIESFRFAHEKGDYGV